MDTCQDDCDPLSGGCPTCRAAEPKAPEKAPGEYLIPMENLPRLSAQMEKLSRKAVKLGSAPITLETFGRVEQRKRNDITGVTTVTVLLRVKVSGEAPRINGWTFAATLQHEEGGTIVRQVSTLPESTLRQYRNATPWCDHCATDRRRNDTFIVRHDDGTLRQVGRNCLRDFLGHDDPMAIASLAEMRAAAQALCESAEDDAFGGGSGGARAWDLEEFLSYACAMVREQGWCPKSKEAPEFGRVATATLVLSDLTGRGKKWLRSGVTDVDTAKASAVIETLTEAFEAKGENASDYEHNLRVILLGGYVDARMAGLACSAVGCYDREMARRADVKLSANSRHVGTVGERAMRVLTVIRTHSYESQFGPGTVVNFRDAEGNALVWFGSGSHNLKPGTEYEVTATVKKHGTDRNGNAETILTRCSVEEMGSAVRAAARKLAEKEAKKEAAKAARAAKKAAKASETNGEVAS